MGTNYYAERQEERTHIGKSSAGWRFLFKADPEWPREDALKHWINLVMDPATVVRDEYHAIHPKEEFLAAILGKQAFHDHGEYDPLFFGPDRTLFDFFKKDHWNLGGLNFTDREFC